jgi:hypothetical protein
MNATTTLMTACMSGLHPEEHRESQKQQVLQNQLKPEHSTAPASWGR